MDPKVMLEVMERVMAALAPQAEDKTAAERARLLDVAKANTRDIVGRIEAGEKMLGDKWAKFETANAKLISACTDAQARAVALLAALDNVDAMAALVASAFPGGDLPVAYDGAALVKQITATVAGGHPNTDAAGHLRDCEPAIAVVRKASFAAIAAQALAA